MRIAYRFIFVFLLAAIVWQSYASLESKRLATASNAALAVPAVAPVSDADPGAIAVAVADTSTRFSCDGRTTCTQMRSCDEAKYFLKNCPNTKMDGNHDGVPCQIQWCR